MNDERAEDRFEICEIGQVTVLGHPDVTVVCQIRNFSRYGMCITVELDIACGRIVKVEWDKHFLVGRVQRVSAFGENFRVGLELLQCSKWNEPTTSLPVPAQSA
jgi:hypothetical protein